MNSWVAAELRLNVFTKRITFKDMNKLPDWFSEIREFYLEHSDPDQRKEFDQHLGVATRQGWQTYSKTWNKLAWLREERMGMIDWEGDPQVGWRDRERIAFSKWRHKRSWP